MIKFLRLLINTKKATSNARMHEIEKMLSDNSSELIKLFVIKKEIVTKKRDDIR